MNSKKEMYRRRRQRSTRVGQKPLKIKVVGGAAKALGSFLKKESVKAYNARWRRTSGLVASEAFTQQSQKGRRIA